MVFKFPILEVEGRNIISKVLHFNRMKRKNKIQELLKVYKVFFFKLYLPWITEKQVTIQVS